jgi:hypothetical protein
MNFWPRARPRAGAGASRASMAKMAALPLALAEAAVPGCRLQPHLRMLLRALVATTVLSTANAWCTCQWKDGLAIAGGLAHFRGNGASSSSHAWQSPSPALLRLPSNSSHRATL